MLTPGRATSASSRSALIPAFCSRCATSFSTRRLPARSISLPGQAYEEADNGNRSQVHWDMVNIQRPEYGGGEIYFDGKLIRRDGEFLPKQLALLESKRIRQAVEELIPNLPRDLTITYSKNGSQSAAVFC